MSSSLILLFRASPGSAQPSLHASSQCWCHTQQCVAFVFGWQDGLLKLGELLCSGTAHEPVESESSSAVSGSNTTSIPFGQLCKTEGKPQDGLAAGLVDITGNAAVS